MKVIVTGGAGYIGSVATERLLAQGHTVAVYDNLYMGHREAVPSDATFVEGDLSDRGKLQDLFQDFRPDGVLHFASHTMVGESMDHPFLYLGDNVRNALNLLEVMLENGTNRIILSSTANLFDQPERMPISETERIVPGSPYGESKYIIERIFYWLHRTRGLRYACLRYFNASGATKERGEDRDPETHLIPLVLQVALGKREKFSIFGNDYDTPDGTCVRDFIHIADLADAHILALEKLSEVPEMTFNLGNGRGFSILEVIEMARKITGHPIPVEFGPRRPGDPGTLIADSSKARAELGWKPQYDSLESIVRSAYEWHAAHPDGY